RVLSTSEAYAEGSDVLRARTLRAKVRALPLGIDLTRFTSPSPRVLAAAAATRERHGDGPLLLAVGRLVYYKGLSTAIDALAELPRAKLLIVGRGPLETTLRRHARERGVAERVAFVDYLDDDELAGAYRAATALWFPSV